MTDTTTEATEATEAAAPEPKVTPRLKTRYREEILPALRASSTSRTSCRCPA